MMNSRVFSLALAAAILGVLGCGEGGGCGNDAASMKEQAMKTKKATKDQASEMKKATKEQASEAKSATPN